MIFPTSSADGVVTWKIDAPPPQVDTSQTTDTTTTTLPANNIEAEDNNNNNDNAAAVTVSGTVFHDVNGNGLNDDSSSAALSTTTTTAAAELVNNIVVDLYDCSSTEIPNEWILVTRTSNSIDDVSNSVHPENGRTVCKEYGVGDDEYSLDAGFVPEEDVVVGELPSSDDGQQQQQPQPQLLPTPAPTPLGTPHTNGDMPGSGMFLLLSNFLWGKMFDIFVAARLNEVQLRRPVTCNLIGRTTGGGGPRYRMMYPTINHGGTNNNGNTKQRTAT